MHYLMLIRDLYGVENSFAQDITDDQIVIERRKRSLPILEQIKQSMHQDADQHLSKSAMAGAISYAQNQWGKLTAYVDFGETRIDNNLTEQAIRPTKLGAKNWLFIGHPNAGPRTAMIYTILECCRRHKVEPLAYLNDMLRRLPSMTNHQVRDAKLSPRDWKPADA